MILWLFLVSFFFLTNTAPLVLGAVNEANHSTTISEAKVHPEASLLVEKICNLFRLGHSIEEVVAIFVEQKEYSYEVEKTIKYLYEVLHKQNLNNNSTSIVIDNKQSEEFYAQKNFNIKVKRAAIIATIIIVGYLLFKFHNLLAEKFNIFWSSSDSSSNKTDTSKDNSSEPSIKEIQKTIDPKGLQNNVCYNQRTTTEEQQQPNETISNTSTQSTPYDLLKNARFYYTTEVDQTLLRKFREAIRKDYDTIEKEK